jgi:hypothetical protein
MPVDLREFVLTHELLPSEIGARTRAIHAQALKHSKHLDGENFACIHPDDLEQIFDLYDHAFFDRGCRRLLVNTPLSFRLSKRMTSAAGTTTRLQKRDRQKKTTDVRYEIAISTTLMFQAFREKTRPITVNGVRCYNRMDALQRVMEHEIVHLLEMLLWTHSQCSGRRFRSIANRFFGHTDYTHQLITPRERALTKYGIRAGDRVRFRFDGEHVEGVVNRITKRATVLVEHKRGELYSDGKKYQKFYVPLASLELVKRI